MASGEPIISNDLTWDDALGGGKYVKFEDGKPKTIVITGWGFYKKLNDRNEEQIGFRARVLEEDGKVLSLAEEKVIDSTSIRLKLKLKPILEKRQPSEKITLTIVKVGDKKDTQFSVTEIGAKAPSSFNQKLDLAPETIEQNKTPHIPVQESITMEELDKKLSFFMSLKEKGSITQDGYDKVVEQLSKIPIKF